MKAYKILTALLLISITLGATEVKKVQRPLYSEKVGKFKIWTHENGDIYLERLHKDLKVMLLNITGTRAGILSVKSFENFKNIKQVKYYAGSSGTSVEVHHHRIALWSESKEAFIGDYFFEDVEAQSKKTIEKSIFKIKNGLLKVYLNGKVLGKLELK